MAPGAFEANTPGDRRQVASNGMGTVIRARTFTQRLPRGGDKSLAKAGNKGGTASNPSSFEQGEGFFVVPKGADMMERMNLRWLITADSPAESLGRSSVRTGTLILHILCIDVQMNLA
jgi:hypothetical protein